MHRHPRPRFAGVLVLLLQFATCLVASAQSPFEFDKNSVRKIRVQPSPQAARIGSAILWQPTFAAAMAESKSTGKPILWYVPTLRGSFMDRKTEIDRYMMAGPFSWPDIVSTINAHYVPVRAKPNRQQQQQYKLVPFVFIEPGVVILQPDGTAQIKLDRLTTLHPQWFHQLLSRVVGRDIAVTEKSPELARAWELFRSGMYDRIQIGLPPQRRPEATEKMLLAGMVKFRLGDHEKARQLWKGASTTQPDHPLAWKAAAEAEGIGPFARGFEVHRNLPDSALAAGRESPGSAAPRGVYSESDIWHRSTDFLLAMQANNGSYTDSDYDFGGNDSLPNVHVAVTSIAGMALMASSKHLPANDPRQMLIGQAVDSAADFVADDANLNYQDRDELVWALAYRCRFLARKPDKTETQTLALRRMVETLAAMQTATGGWFHEYPNPFVTATALAALAEAQRAGIEVSQGVIQKGTKSLAGDRFNNGAYPYSSRQPNNQPATKTQIAASGGRMPLCEMALKVWGRTTDDALTRAIDQSFKLNDNLMAALKYDDHTSRFAYGGFFFWYDVRGRSEAIASLPDSESKIRFQNLQRELILSLPEIDGCFVDSHELGRVYGTAMALLSLHACGVKAE